MRAQRPVMIMLALVVAGVAGWVIFAQKAPGNGFVGSTQAQSADRLEIATAGGRHAFSVEIVADEAKRAEGLMFRKSMAADHGMLFDFRREQEVFFWMKDTYLSLDMIFIRSDGTVASIAENATPLSEATIPSGRPVRFVFEVLAGTAKRIGLKAGDRVTHPLMRPAVP